MQEIKLSLVTSQPDDDLTLDTILPNGKKLNTLKELSNFEKQLGEDDDIRKRLVNIDLVCLRYV